MKLIIKQYKICHALVLITTLLTSHICEAAFSSSHSYSHSVSRSYSSGYRVTSIKPSVTTSSIPKSTPTPSVSTAKPTPKNASNAVGKNLAIPQRAKSGSELAGTKGVIKQNTASQPANQSNRFQTQKTNSISKPIPGADRYKSLSQSAPSQTLRNQINAQASSNHNWSQLALMYVLLSNHNAQASQLTDSDKNWIKSQITEEENKGPGSESVVRELKASGVDTKNIVSFSYMEPSSYIVGKKIMMVITATKGNVNRAPKCTIAGGEYSSKHEFTEIAWTPPSPAGKKIKLTCTAFGKSESKFLITAKS